jgi:alkanesulfonate monooxygenase SsuD/methylene tetrahydromethanopterin reductase-like flavin-dependent oxidoreductase (luciferase family)
MGNRKMEHWIAWFHETHSGGEAIVIARAAEQLGFSGIALSDHVALPKQQQAGHPMLGIPYDPRIPVIEPITTAATMAAVTETLRFMIYAYVIGMREPFSAANYPDQPVVFLVVPSGQADPIGYSFRRAAGS